jgi:hypothetical protein
MAAAVMEPVAKRSAADPESIVRGLAARSCYPGFICPDYDGYCITNIAPLVLRNFGQEAAAPGALTALLGRSYRHVVVFIIDAMGYRLMERCAAENPALARVLGAGACVPITSTFPSTTTVALTAIYTGLSPAEHGVTGHTMFVRSMGSVVDILRFSPLGDRRRDVYIDQGWDVRRLFPMRTVFEPLKEAGFRTLSITRSMFRDTALGRLHHAGAEVRGYLELADMLTLTRAALRGTQEPVLTCVYWDTIDMLSHEYGPNSEAVRAAIALVFGGLEREVLSQLTPRERRETLLLITADHGQVDCPAEEAICLGEHPSIVDSLLLPPAGQSRAAYLYGLPRSVEQLASQLRVFEERLEVTTSWQALAQGLFGAPDHAAQLDTRIGDVIALTRGGAQLLWVDHQRENLGCHGRHGSLTEEEMLVPLVVLPLDQW